MYQVITHMSNVSQEKSSTKHQKPIDLHILHNPFDMESILDYYYPMVQLQYFGNSVIIPMSSVTADHTGYTYNFLYNI